MRDELLSRAGLLLYRQLPEEYRYQDNRNDPNELADLEAYLHGFGAFLDLARGTLEQLYADGYAESADNGRAIQSWLLPYLAELVGANLLSPRPDARTAELDHSVGWYKGKGTLFALDDIADVVMAAEAVAVEGWRRTLVTPRLGLPPFSTPVASIGDGDVLGPTPLPLGTPDVRKMNRAVADLSGGTSITAFQLPQRDANGMRLAPRRLFWKSLARAGAPCAPGHFDDTSVRTPDIRDPSFGDVGPQPKRIIIYVQPPQGLFEAGLLSLSAVGADPLHLQAGPAEHVIGPAEALAALGVPHGPQPPDKIVITGDLTIPAGKKVTFQGVLLHDKVTVTGDACLILRRSSAGSVVLPALVAAHPSLDAQDALIGAIDGATGWARLEYVTVLGDVHLARLQASDCILAGTLNPTVCDDGQTCLRYSRIPETIAPLGCPVAHAQHNTSEAPLFMRRPFGTPGGCTIREPHFGEPGAGVLSHRSPLSIRAGAERGGEMGACHHLYYAASLDALAAKLVDFLPLGQQLSIRYDERLTVAPPRVTAGP